MVLTNSLVGYGSKFQLLTPLTFNNDYAPLFGQIVITGKAILFINGNDLIIKEDKVQAGNIKGQISIEFGMKVEFNKVVFALGIVIVLVVVAQKTPLDFTLESE